MHVRKMHRYLFVLFSLFVHLLDYLLTYLPMLNRPLNKGINVQHL